MILSFHPIYVGHENRLCAGRDPDNTDIELMRSAEAVILPQGCRQSLYEAARESCPRVFPNYDARFAWPEKTGQSRMFMHFKAPHPLTAVFDSTRDFDSRCGSDPAGAGLQYPFVFKYNGPGEGANVWLVEKPETFTRLLDQAMDWEKTGQYGFVLQQYIKTKGRSLRVVVTGSAIISYWRIQSSPENFHSSVSHGAKIDHTCFEKQRSAAEEQVRRFCRQTGINLAGFDLIYPESGSDEQAGLFLEVNYFFGRQGLGGSENFYRILCREIDNWLKQTG